MPSFDIVNKVDAQLLDNAINVARKEIINRFDFSGSKSEISLDNYPRWSGVLDNNGSYLDLYKQVREKILLEDVIDG